MTHGALVRALSLALSLALTLVIVILYGAVAVALSFSLLGGHPSIQLCVRASARVQHSIFGGTHGAFAIASLDGAFAVALFIDTLGIINF